MRLINNYCTSIEFFGPRNRKRTLANENGYTYVRLPCRLLDLTGQFLRIRGTRRPSRPSDGRPRDIVRLISALSLYAPTKKFVSRSSRVSANLRSRWNVPALRYLDQKNQRMIHSTCYLSFIKLIANRSDLAVTYARHLLAALLAKRVSMSLIILGRVCN